MNKFYEIAKDAAEIIHEKSWEGHRVKDVLLYGSTLNSDSPSDIDLLIIHDSIKLKDFSIYTDKPLKVDEPVGKENARERSYSIFHQLSYKYEERRNDTVVAAIGKRIAPLNLGTCTNEEIKKADEKYRKIFENVFPDKFDVSNVIDLYGIDNIFDVHVLHTKALIDDSGKKRESISVKTPSEIRKEAIESCKDKKFWHTILSEGRIYDKSTHDFSQTVEEKYPRALSLFPSK